VPFIVGVNRSGTTLLRLMLDAHPEMAIPPETHFIPALKRYIGKQDPTPEEVVAFLVAHRRWGDFGLDPDELLDRIRRQKLLTRKVVRSFYELYAEKQGKTRFGDKTPGYVKQMGIIQRAVGGARFVHLIRDGRDVAISREARVLDEELPVERLAKIWKRRISRARGQAEHRVKHYMELRYEDLVVDPEAGLRRVCPAMLDYHQHAAERLSEIDRDLPGDAEGATRPAAERIAAHSLATEPPRPDRLYRWKEGMSAEDEATFERVAGDLLADLGYEVRHPAREAT
jgi:hypothetical protein